MSQRQRLVDDLIRDEGMRQFPYVDGVGKITIGCGRNLTDCGLSSAEIMLLLDHDLDDAIHDLTNWFPWFVRLNEVRQRALTSMRFNLGPAGFRTFAKMIKALARDDYPTAADEAQASPWFTQVGRRGPRIVHALRTGADL